MSQGPKLCTLQPDLMHSICPRDLNYAPCKPVGTLGFFFQCDVFHMSQGPEFCSLATRDGILGIALLTLYQINALYVAFIHLTANVETTWQTTTDDFVDVMRVLQDRKP